MEAESNDRRWWEDEGCFEAVQQLFHTNCVLMRPSPDSNPCCMSVTLEPSLFPERQYELVRELQPHFNSLVDSVSRDHEFLVQTFEKYVHEHVFVS